MDIKLDKYFGMAILLLVGAVVVFPFWIMHEVDNLITPVQVSVGITREAALQGVQVVETSPLTAADQVDPILAETLVDEGVVSEDFIFDDVDALTNIDDVMFDDLAF